MGLHLPASRGSFKVRLTLFDSAWALLSPLFALYVRDAYILSYDSLLPTILYCSLSVVFSLIAFSAFRIHDGMTRFFSVHDAVDVTKAVAIASLLTYVAVFTLTRLEGVPRSTPIIQSLILLAGLIGVRIITRLIEGRRTAPTICVDVSTEHIVMIGSNRLSLLYIKFIRAYSPGLHRIMAVLDDRPEMIGRAIDGVRVIGPTHHLESVVNEFAEHGIGIGRVIVGGDPDMLSQSTLREIRRVCDHHQMRLDFVPQLVGLHALQSTQPQIADRPRALTSLDATLSRYFVLKRFLDLFATVTVMVVLLPVWLLIGLVALWDVGSPIFFWQQRLGYGGRPFLLQKIRTLKPPFDEGGRKVPEAKRLSFLGRFLRKCRFDEVPQLLNVLVGDMSLIGPRPLLPRDQPANPVVRLSVRPGITGWAQVNGGTLLSADEKDALDEWYIRHASLQLDLRIIFMTLKCVFQGERRSETAIAAARAMRNGQRAVRPFEAPLIPVLVTSEMLVQKVSGLSHPFTSDSGVRG
jgi:lipopolysaccharide/colanic/teichoic acid biosynthesis glycosyltransferase